MQNIKISFLVTFYNQEEFVKNNIESILAIEKDFDWEILIGDDGSTDNTVELVNKYISIYPNNIKLFVMPRELNKKYDSILRASANRLNLLNNSTGNYFCVVDGDDWYCDKSFVKEAINILEKNKELSLCAFNFKRCWENNEELNITNLKEGINNPEEYIKAPYTHAAACVLRQVYDKERISFMQKFGYFDDNDIVLSSLNYGKLYYIEKVVYSYRQTGTSIWTSLDEFEHKVINAFHYDILKEYCNKYSEAVIKRQFDALYFVWQNRRKYFKLLPKEKAEKYIDLAKRFDDSFFIKLLDYDKLTLKERKSIKKIFKPAFKYVVFCKRVKNKVTKFLSGD